MRFRNVEPGDELPSAAASDREDIMRIALIAIIVVTQLLSGTASALACPVGYAQCGSHFCCPK
jgi:hypothetical protein